MRCEAVCNTCSQCSVSTCNKICWHVYISCRWMFLTNECFGLEEVLFHRRFTWSPWKWCLGGKCVPSTAISITSLIYYDHAATSTTIYTIPTIALTRVWSVSYHMERSYSNWWPYTACITGRLHASALQLLCRIVDVTAWQPRDLVANFVSI